MVDEQYFLDLAAKFLLKDGQSVTERKYRGFFGICPTITLVVWDKIQFNSIKPVHLLYALMFLKVYATEEILSATF